MKQIPFSGMLCHPTDIEKDGDFRIKGTVSAHNNSHMPIVRYEYFPCSEERDKRYKMIMNLLKDGA